jgi:hypothetical protein
MAWHMTRHLSDPWDSWTGFYSKFISVDHLPADFVEPPLCKVIHFINHSLLPVAIN